MKNQILVFVFTVLMPVMAVASDMRPAGGYYETYSDNCDAAMMQRALDDATAARRAVITVVKCEPQTAAHAAVSIDAHPMARSVHPGNDCIDCMAPVERVIDRRIYVQETVQRYAPVVTYVPVGEYIRTRRVCN